MPAERGNRRNRPVAGVARMSTRPPDPLRLVDDEEIDTRAYRLVGQLRPLYQGLERDDDAAMHVEWVEVGSEVARDIRKARSVEQREHVVVLSPKLAQPLHGQRLRHDDQTTLDLRRVHQVIEDQARFDRLAESHFVGKQPTHRISSRRTFGDIQLVRKQANASAEERANAALANRPKASDVAQDLGVDGSDHILAIEPRIPNPESRISDPESRLIDTRQRIAVGGDAQRLAGSREVDNERAPFDGRDPPDAELGIEAMGEVIASLPRMCGVGHLQMITDNERMTERAYTVARAVAPRIHAHFSSHQHPDRQSETGAGDMIPDEGAIEAMIDTAFWASLRREEAYVPKISLAFLPPAATDHPLVLERSLPLDPAVLTRVSPAVERPGIHLGVAYVDGELRVWGTAQAIPLHCFVAEVVEPGLIVVKHRRGREAAKFVNVAVLEGDRIKVIDEKASAMPDCPTLLTHTPRLRAT